MQIQKTGFSLIETMVGMLIVSIIMVSAFQAISSVGIAKVKIIEQTELEKQAYFASERFFEMIKKGGTIDYEEYWNRYNHDTSYSSGHFAVTSGFGNFGDDTSTENTSYGNRPYYCLSGNANSMGTGGCLTDHNIQFNLAGAIGNKIGPQRYMQYQEHFIDRNSDADNDMGDEDGDGSILHDDDDLFLGIGPAAFSGSSDLNKVGELYLISNDGNERTFFRWNVGLDPDVGGASCSGGESMTGTGCLGTIEFLKLTGKDYGYNHNPSSIGTDGSQGDGIIDTWIIHEDFNPSGTEVIAGNSATDYWQAIFPNTIHVSDVEFYVYPNKSLEYSWRDTDPSIFIAPYVQIKMTLQPSAQVKRKIKGKSPEVKISTTIQLSNLDLK